MKITPSNRKEAYEAVCNSYIEDFCKKQGLYFEDWVGDRVGEIANISSYSFYFSDIKYDIDTNQPAGQIIDWMDDQEQSETRFNYFSYSLGLRGEIINNKKNDTN